MNRKEVLEYVRTVLIALLVALVLAGVATGFSKVIAEHHAKLMEKISNNSKDNELIGFLITKYSEESVKNPGDYTINLKLGSLYELLFSNKQAEEQYQKSINKSPYGVYSPFFAMANLKLKQGKYQDGINIIKKLKNTDHKPLLIAKGDFYMNAGDALSHAGEYEDALKQYKIAFFFYKKVDSSKKEDALRNILDTYNLIADINFMNGDMGASIDNLETALLYKETSAVFYKLAILYKRIDPVQANIYIEKAFAIDPGLINYDIYQEILLNLIDLFSSSGMETEKELYQNKLRSLKNFEKRYVISQNDVKIDVTSFKISHNLFRTKTKIKVKFKIENNSLYDMNILFVNAKLRYDDRFKEIYDQRFYSKKAPLKSKTVSDEYKFEYEFTNKDEVSSAKELSLNFYVSKKDNMRKIPVLKLEIKK